MFRCSETKRPWRLTFFACIGIFLAALVEAFEWPKLGLKSKVSGRLQSYPSIIGSTRSTLSHEYSLSRQTTLSGIVMGSGIVKRSTALGAVASTAANKAKTEPKKPTGVDSAAKAPAPTANESTASAAGTKATPAAPVKKPNAKNDAPTEEEERQMTRDETLSSVLHHIDKLYGKGSILRLGDASSMNIETFSSGALTLDIALGGGYPKGRVIEIFGPESSGKTTLALHAVASLQKDGGLYIKSCMYSVFAMLMTKYLKIR